MAEDYVNDFDTTLDGSITNTATSLVVIDSPPAALTPNFRIRIEDEIILVTAIGGTGNKTWTVTREAEEATRFPKAAHSSGVAVAHVLTAGSLDTIITESHTIELDYAQVTSNTNITATTEGTANTIVTGNSVAYDGATTIYVEFYAPFARPDDTANGRELRYYLYDGSSSIGRIGLQIAGQGGGPAQLPIFVSRRLTPSSASHTYSIRGSVNAGTGVVVAGAGGSGADMPAFIRISKVL